MGLEFVLGDGVLRRHDEDDSGRYDATKPGNSAFLGVLGSG